MAAPEPARRETRPADRGIRHRPREGRRGHYPTNLREAATLRELARALKQRRAREQARRQSMEEPGLDHFEGARGWVSTTMRCRA